MVTKVIKIAFIVLIAGFLLTIVSFFALGGEFRNAFNIDDRYEAEELNHAVSEITDIKIDAFSHRIEVIQTEGSDIRLAYHVAEDDGLIALIEDGELRLTHTPQSFWQRLNFTAQWRSVEVRTIYLYLPQTYEGHMTLLTRNGSIIIEGINFTEGLHVTTNNGDIRLRESRVTGDITFKTSNGRITLFDVEASGEIKLDSSNGTFNLELVKAGNRLYGKTSNGTINLKDSEAEKIEMLSSNGSVNLTRIHTSDVIASTSNGKVNVSIYGNQDDFKLYLRTSNGKVYLNDLAIASGQTLNSDKTSSIHLRSSNGNVTLTFIN